MGGKKCTEVNPSSDETTLYLSHFQNSQFCLLCQVEFLPYDERPLPAICKQPDEAIAYLEPEMAEGAIDDTPKSGITGEPEPLSEKALREASPAIEVFGEALVKKTTKYTHRLLWSVFS